MPINSLKYKSSVCQLEVCIMLVLFVKYTSNLVGISLVKSYTANLWKLFKSACLFHFLNTRLNLPTTFVQINITIDLTWRPKK